MKWEKNTNKIQICLKKKEIESYYQIAGKVSKCLVSSSAIILGQWQLGLAHGQQTVL